ncbi:hypothetical protein QJ856_gp0814 [Tupanvirus deep ocean]|uniref:Uncharacterized protein n=2 Tax=Tupanvirus TaxID=2094720 RepID=A0AC62A872_9VIRU|nr:hypothetical protein QJ856_gp0814 [Tupanvirus deep ocean]QKU33939.1 hypothetical protein [Tupanvirus deep ocean]
METSSKRLNGIMEEIALISIDTQNLGKKPLQMEKKLQNYTKGNLLIDEATQLIEKLEQEIQNIDFSKADKSQINKVNEYIDLLQRTNPRFDEVMYIVEQLKAISSGLPLTTEIHDNIEQEVVHEHEEITNP